MMVVKLICLAFYAASSPFACIKRQPPRILQIITLNSFNACKPFGKTMLPACEYNLELFDHCGNEENYCGATPIVGEVTVRQCQPPCITLRRSQSHELQMSAAPVGIKPLRERVVVSCWRTDASYVKFKHPQILTSPCSLIVEISPT
jgi:hypothetical protein